MMEVTPLGSASRVKPCAVRSTDAHIINTSYTRYHVVRAAAVALGWRLWDHEASVDVPATYYTVSLRTPEATASTDSTWEVLWMDKSVLPTRVTGLLNCQRVNHFPGMNAVGRKAVLFRRLMSFVDQCTLLSSATSLEKSRRTSLSASALAGVTPEAAADLAHLITSFAPRSFLSTRDLSALERDVAHHADGASPRYYIIKPNRGCQGRGIRVTAAPMAALTAVECTAENECLIQVYVDRPLLIEQKKFDLRLYVLLLSVASPHWPAPSALSRARTGMPAASAARPVPPAAGPFDGVSLFIHEEGLVRICAEPYAAPTEKNCHKASMHLTNYAVNKTSAAFCQPTISATDVDTSTDRCDADHDKDDGSGVEETGNKRSLRAMPAVINQATQGTRQWHGDVWRRVQECVTLTVLSSLGVLRRGLEESGALRGNKADGRVCFELLGFDVMLRDGSCQPVLMEVNHSPSMFCDSAFDFSIKQRVVMDSLRLVAAHMPLPTAVTASHQSDASCEKAYLAAAQKQWKGLEAAQTALVTDGTVRYHQLLPRRICPPHAPACHAGDTDSEDAQDWTSEERCRQHTMAALSQQR